ncbi:MAG: hotdog fold thioesterase [Nitrospiraceae bacterium]|nr:hotdog fold thioesterase [Nitrospiraceae bacterium]
MTESNPDNAKTVESVFGRARFIRDLGIELEGLGPGWCESRLQLTERHLQQDDYVHAGVLATMADHTAGASGQTMAAADGIVLTVEFKINFLRPATGEWLRCRAEVLKAGQSLIVSESEVYASLDGAEKLVAKATVTLAVVAAPSY